MLEFFRCRNSIFRLAAALDAWRVRPITQFDSERWVFVRNGDFAGTHLHTAGVPCKFKVRCVRCDLRSGAIYPGRMGPDALQTQREQALAGKCTKVHEI